MAQHNDHALINPPVKTLHPKYFTIKVFTITFWLYNTLNSKLFLAIHTLWVGTQVIYAVTGVLFRSGS